MWAECLIAAIFAMVASSCAEEGVPLSSLIDNNKAIPLDVDPLLCATRTIHDYMYPGSHGYFFSWEEPGTSKLELDWSEAREFCRARCMELVSMETSRENKYIKDRLVKGRQRFMWTSGRKCTFAGCDRPDLKPVNVFGWFWTGSLQKMAPTTNRVDTDWSDRGGFGRPQPDNREKLQGGPEEECLAILNNFYGDGPRWHDIACKHRKPFVCEESDTLLASVSQTPTI
ncbi:L-selectin-like [Hetaerina americana]|uniref:L-selectin-like n=1 Tax=Hetaerina americana TaxID=62018 RepID=UPI003A7F2B1A